MKRLLIVLGVIAVVLLIFDAVATSWITDLADEKAREMDPMETIGDACDGNQRCLAAVQRYGRSCVTSNGPEVVGLETYLKHVANVMICLNDRSGVEHFPTE